MDLLKEYIHEVLKKLNFLMVIKLLFLKIRILNKSYQMVLLYIIIMNMIYLNLHIKIKIILMYLDLVLNNQNFIIMIKRNILYLMMVHRRLYMNQLMDLVIRFKKNILYFKMVNLNKKLYLEYQQFSLIINKYRQYDLVLQKIM